MKCYICFTESVLEREDYLCLLEVSLKSAKLNTSLQMLCLYDGKKNPTLDLLAEKYDMQIIYHEFPFKQELCEIYPEQWMANEFGRIIEYSRIFGAFLRWEIPVVEQEDKYVLYVDVDVIFESDITLEDLPCPKYLAAAPEFDKDIQNMEYFNSGVLLMNVQGMQQKYKVFAEMMKAKVRNKIQSLDQGYLNQLCFQDMDLLPLEYNWKPYWGINDKAKIVHLHGMKPGCLIDGAGFHTDNNFFYKVFSQNKNGYAGYVYYFSQFNAYLGKLTDPWLSNHLQYIFNLYQEQWKPQSNNQESNNRKLRKYRKLFKISIAAIILLLSLLMLLIAL